MQVSVRNVLVLPEQRQYFLVGFVDLFSPLGTSEHNFTASEDKQDNLWLIHPEYESWEELRVIPAVNLASLRLHVQRFKLDLKAYIVRSYNVLYGEVCQVHVRIRNLLELLRIVFGSRMALLL